MKMPIPVQHALKLGLSRPPLTSPHNLKKPPYSLTHTQRNTLRTGVSAEASSYRLYIIPRLSYQLFN